MNIDPTTHYDNSRWDALEEGDRIQFADAGGETFEARISALLPRQHLVVTDAGGDHEIIIRDQIQALIPDRLVDNHSAPSQRWEGLSTRVGKVEVWMGTKFGGVDHHIEIGWSSSGCPRAGDPRPNLQGVEEFAKDLAEAIKLAKTLGATDEREGDTDEILKEMRPNGPVKVAYTAHPTEETGLASVHSARCPFCGEANTFTYSRGPTPSHDDDIPDYENECAHFVEIDTGAEEMTFKEAD